MTLKSSADISLVRVMNQRIVLDAIFNAKVTSRTQLAGTLSLSKPAISDNLTALINAGLVKEVGEGDANKSGGRKPIMLSFNKDNRYIVAIDLNYSNPVFVLTNLSGEVVREFDIKISKATPEDAYISIIEDGINLLLTSSGITQDKLLSISIASPGVFDNDGNQLSHNPKFSGIPWWNIDFKKVLRDKYDVQILIMNDINAAALGEWTHWEGNDEESMLFVSCGNGLGSGIILDGKLYEGRHFNAGEIYKYTDMQHIESAHTLEDSISASALIEQCTKHSKSGSKTKLPKDGKIDFPSIVTAYKEHDPFVMNMVEKVCNELSILTLNYSMLLSLDCVIFGGDYIAFGETYLQCLRENAKKLDYELRSIQLASQGQYSGIRGLIYRTREQYFDTVCRMAHAESQTP